MTNLNKLNNTIKTGYELLKAIATAKRIERSIRKWNHEDFNGKLKNNVLYIFQDRFNIDKTYEVIRTDAKYEVEQYVNGQFFGKMTCELDWIDRIIDFNSNTPIEVIDLDVAEENTRLTSIFKAHDKLIERYRMNDDVNGTMKRWWNRIVRLIQCRFDNIDFGNSKDRIICSCENQVFIAGRSVEGWDIRTYVKLNKFGWCRRAVLNLRRNYRYWSEVM